MKITGFVMPALAIGLGAMYVKPKRGFFPPMSDDGPTEVFQPHVTTEEHHTDALEITDHPVEQGAAITDHAFKRPATVVIKCAWSNSPKPAGSGLVGAALGVAGLRAPVVGAAISAGQTLSAVSGMLSGGVNSYVNSVYKKLVALQESRVPFDVYTGKRAYKNMLFQSLTVTTDSESENALVLTATCRQIIIVSTQTVSVPINNAALKLPEKTASIVNAGQKQLQAVRNAINPELSLR